jgi:hypothetical protein
MESFPSLHADHRAHPQQPVSPNAPLNGFASTFVRRRSILRFEEIARSQVGAAALAGGGLSLNG